MEPSGRTALAPGQDLTSVRGQLVQLVEMGNNVRSAGWGPQGAERVLRAFLDFDERGRQLLRTVYADRGPLTRFETSLGQALRFTPPPGEALGRTIYTDVDDKVDQLQQLITALDAPLDAGEQQGPRTSGGPEGEPVESAAGALGADAPAAPNAGVFVVHGHDDGIKETVARFLEKATPGPVVILHEQPNAGATIIEKLERYSGVAFAVVLLTGDDVMTLAGADHPVRRARQNVILELGWFAARLGRSKVCALYRTGVELPSDYDGILYTSLSGDWRRELLRELDAAGLPVSWEALR